MSDRTKLAALRAIACVMFSVCVAIGMNSQSTAAAIGWYVLAGINFHTGMSATSSLARLDP